MRFFIFSKAKEKDGMVISISHIDHVVLDTGDLDECVNYYEGIFAMQAIGWNGSKALKFGRQKINVHPLGQEFSPTARLVAPGGKAIVLEVSPGNRLVRENLKKYGTYEEEYLKDFNEARVLHDPDGDLIIACKAEQPGDFPLCLQGVLLATDGLDAMLAFYAKFLGAYAIRAQDAAIMLFGGGYIGLVSRKSNALAEKNRLIPGTGDFCLMATGKIEDIYEYLKANDAPFDQHQGIVPRHGATGPINSIYLRDPDGNLVEVCTLVSADKTFS